MTPLFKNSIVLFGAKRKMLREMAGSIRTLVVGSSHGDFGFNPAYCPNSFNLCSRSQDLRHSFHLYRKVAEDAPELRHVVLFYSLFSPGNFMELSPSERDICPALNEMFGLGLHYADSYLAVLSEIIEGQLTDVSIDLDGHAGFFPTTDKHFFDESYGVRRRVADHLKLNRNDAAHVYLEQILMYASVMGHKVFIVVPPVRQDYKQACGLGFDALFKALLNSLHSAQKNHPGVMTHLINAYDDADFDDDLFGDFDHLRPTDAGPRLLATKISDAISNHLG